MKTIIVLSLLVSQMSMAADKNCLSMLNISTEPEFNPPSAWSVEQSKKTADHLGRNKDAASNFDYIKARLQELNPKPALAKTTFSRGSLYTIGGQLIWEMPNGEKVILADKPSEPGRVISKFLVSPDEKKVAYATTLGGADVHHWYMKELSPKGRLLNEQNPVVVRMDGFSWGKNSDVVYYSYFHKKELVKKGLEPVVEIRARHLRNGVDRVLFDHNLPENLEIFDVDGGKTLFAHRILGAPVGIKVVFTGFIGRWNSQKSDYEWERLDERNQYISSFLGVIGTGDAAKALLASNKVGSHYGVIAIPLKKLKAGEKRGFETLIPADPELVLHMSQLANGHLILQYNNPKTMEISYRVYGAHDLQLKSEFKMSDFGLDASGVGPLWNIQGRAPEAYFNFIGLSVGVTTLKYDFRNHKAELIKNSEELKFDFSKVKVQVTQYRAYDGTLIPAQVIYPVDSSGKAIKPKFVFVRTYGGISVINRPEPKEAQMVLDMGGAYIAASVRGGGEKGADWFYAGAKDKLKTIADIAAASDFAQTGFTPWKKMGLTSADVVALGRSWGGLHSLLLASYYPEKFAMIHSIVPVINLADMLENGWFGRIAHSDMAPEVDPRTGDLILDAQFWERMKKIDPWIQTRRYQGQTKLFVATNQWDDRVDQQELGYQLVQRLMDQAGVEGQVRFFEKEAASHGDRWYMPYVMSLIADHYGIQLK